MRKILSFVIVVAMLVTAFIPTNMVFAANYNYGEALQKAIMFYEFQRSGNLDETTIRNNWRGDSGLSDGSDVGKDLTGGWYDAGDHVKFNLPMSYTVSTICWAINEYKSAFSGSGQLTVALDNMKWATDYFIKCHTATNEYYYQVGSGSGDHAWWGPAECMQMARPSYKVTSASGGSAVVAGTAAALAAFSIVYRSTDSAYADTCLAHAKQLYTFANTTRSDAGYTAAAGFYDSWSGFWDELAWSAAWLYLATNDSTYLTAAESATANWGKEGQSSYWSYKWSHCWDDVHNGAQILLAKATGKQVYIDSIERNLDWWTTGFNGEKATYTPKGLAYVSQWGSLRYATTEALLASIWADSGLATASKVAGYQSFAKSQVDYALGSAGRSFEVGFGVNPPVHPHHRTAHSSWADSQTTPANHRHTIYGALVGGPQNSADSYEDSISNYTCNEVACDYNAGFIGVLAKMYSLYGGTPIANFKAIETKTNDEYYVEAGINASGTNFIEIKALINNKSGWPAKVATKLSYKYFVDLTEVINAGKTAADVKVSTNYNQAGAAVTGPIAWDASKNIYYINCDFNGAAIYPGGQSAFKKELQFRIAAPDGTTWNNANDWSYTGIATTPGATPVQVTNIPVYDNGVKVYGNEPGPGYTSTPTPTTGPTNTPTPTPTTGPTNTPTPTPTTGPTNTPSPTPTVGPTNTPTPTPTVGPTSTPAPGGVKVQFFNGNTAASTNSLYPNFKVVNTGTTAVSLSDVKVRYYFTVDTAQPLNFACDWASAGNSNLTGTFVTIAKTNADRYLEIGFTTSAGTLAAGGNTEIKGRIYKSDWSNFTQTNDYSFDATDTNYVDWTKVTGLLAGTLKWGTEP